MTQLSFCHYLWPGLLNNLLAALSASTFLFLKSIFLHTVTGMEYQKSGSVPHYSNYKMALSSLVYKLFIIIRAQLHFQSYLSSVCQCFFSYTTFLLHALIPAVFPNFPNFIFHPSHLHLTSASLPDYPLKITPWVRNVYAGALGPYSIC